MGSSLLKAAGFLCLKEDKQSLWLCERELKVSAVQDKETAGKVEETILGGESNTEDQSQSWDSTRLHHWYKDKLEINTLCKRRKQER